jgi:hypothetical protein
VMDSKGFRSAAQQQPESTRYIRTFEESKMRSHKPRAMEFAVRARCYIQLIRLRYSVALRNVYLLGAKKTFRFVGENHTSFEDR